MKEIYKNKIRWLLLLLLITITSISFAQSIRKHYEEMTTFERDALMNAYSALGGTNGTVGLNAQIANFHGNNFGSIHQNNATNDVFLAWHRQASHELERGMKDNANNEWLCMAYWDWTLSSSKSDALWGSSWLGPFNSPWNLNRSASSGTSFASQSEIDAALMESNFYTFSRTKVEGFPSNIHNNPHGWVGGTMASAFSPKDPAFFFHHNMVDKIWADWYEIHGVSGANYYVKTNMPRYPSVDPDDIADPRSLGIFYAEAGLATLDKYTVNNTFTSSEKYGYKFTIEADNGFIIPNGGDAEFRSCNKIILGPGFASKQGSTFRARIDTDCDFSTTPLMAQTTDGPTSLADKVKDQIFTAEAELKKGIQLQHSFRNFPNPFEGQTTIEYALIEDSEISLEVYNLTGQRVRVLVSNQLQTKGIHRVEFSANDLPDGIYYCSLIRSAENVQTIKLVLSR